MSRNLNEITSWIEKNNQAIIENIDYENIDVYSFLQSEYQKSDTTTNYLFQFVYRSFYRLHLLFTYHIL